MNHSKKLLVLDLDETLLHATKTALETVPQFNFDPYYVYVRPHLETFLTALSAHYTLGIWSSATDAYVAEIVQAIKPASVNFDIVWARSKCSLKYDLTFDTYYYEKRLDKVKKLGYPLEHVLMVDDTREKLRTNYGNAIYIKPYSGEPDDTELLYLKDYLLTLRDVDNVRNIEKRNWRAG